MNIRAIIHDWDDTITNSFESYTQFYFDFGDFHNLGKADLKKIMEYWGGTIPEIVKGVWPDLSLDEAEKKTEVFIEMIRLWRKTYTPMIFPHIKETFLKLDELGIKLGVISSGSSEQMKIIYKDQIDRTLQPHCFIYDNKELGYKKPDARIFDRAFEKLGRFGITESETIYIGDSFQDYQTAKNRRVVFYAVTTGLKTKDDFIKEGLAPEYVLTSFNDILSLFQ